MPFLARSLASAAASAMSFTLASTTALAAAVALSANSLVATTPAGSLILILIVLLLIIILYERTLEKSEEIVRQTYCRLYFTKFSLLYYFCMSNTVKIGLAQFAVKRGDPEYNFEKIEYFCKEAHAAGVQMLCLPEMATTGFDWKVNRALLAESTAYMERLADLARSYLISICGSFLYPSENDEPNNSLFF